MPERQRLRARLLGSSESGFQSADADAYGTRVIYVPPATLPSTRTG